MLLTVVPVAAVQVPHQPILNHQLLSPPVSVKSTERSLLTVAVRVAVGMVKDDDAILVWQPLSE